MMRKSKFRLPRKNTSQKSTKPISESPANEILTLRLSPVTQFYVKCRIGDQIHGETNWIYIKKNDIINSLDYSNDFHDALDAVLDYPEEQMLIGSYGFDQDIAEEYLLCTTIEAKNKRLAREENRKRKLKRIYDMPIYVWTSLGSESEIQAMQNNNLRALLVVEIDSVFPIFRGSRIFSYRVANESVYIECFTKRREFKNVWKRRIDRACQAALDRKDGYCQTRLSTDIRHYTQYEQIVGVQTPKQDQLAKIVTFLELKVPLMEDIMQLNYHIHLYTNDYSEFLNPYVGHVYTNYKEIIACQDIKNCQGMRVSCVSWNPFIKGVFVASYVHTTFDHLYTSEPDYADVETFSSHVALVWSFNDMQKPKLYLHSKRELTVISFCPYDENIVVGGCSNGQVVIWDIRGQLSKAENKEILNPVQQENRSRIAELITWMKKLPTRGHVDASVMSALQHGHRTAVTSITWIPPEYYISSTGQYSVTLEDTSHMQFLTSGLEDNNICVWDLKHYQNVKFHSSRKPLQRLAKIPSALHKDDSPLKKMHYVFIPIFVLFIKDQVNQKPIHVRNMLFKHFNYNYKLFKTTLVDNNYQREYFRLLERETPFEGDQTFVVNTVSGMLYNCTWEGFTYDHGNKINFDNCTLKPFAQIHDAPIKMCISNKEEPNIFLSIGGKVFAIWHRKQSTPILWRRNTRKYIFGKWSYAHPFEILLFTENGFIQLWNFFVNSKYPTHTVRCHGLPPVEYYSNFGVEHYLRNAILLLDRYGAIRIHTAGSRLAAKHSQYHIESHESIKGYIENRKQVQNIATFWVNHFNNQEFVPEEVKPETKVEAVNLEPAGEKKREQISRAQRFEKRQHQYMYEQLTEYKSIHLRQLEENKKILNEVILHNNELGRKCAQAISNKAEFYEKKKRFIMWNSTSKLQRNIYKISLPKECQIKLKKQYFDDYLLMEKDYEKSMKEYKFEFDWKKITKSRSENLKCFAKTKPNDIQALKYNFRTTLQYKTVDLFDD